MTVQTKARRSKITKADIARAREEILAQPKPVKQAIKKLDTEPKWGKDFWLSDRFPDNYGDDINFDSYGLAWGLETNLETRCLGKTEKVLAIIKGEETIPDNACPHTRQILSKLLKDREEENVGTGRPTKSNIQRTRPTRASGNRQKKTRLLKTRERVPLHLPNPQVESLLSR
ncbi:MAG: hypothetical protein NTW48_04210 [Chloroflexi bacterium]|nr:hypothetical protein [Chloroflexota bacterium]